MLNNQKLIEKIHESMQGQINKTGYVTVVDVLMDLNVLTKRDYEKWKKGHVPYLERVVNINLKKLSLCLKEIKAYAKKLNLKPSLTIYQVNGRKQRLKFSKSGLNQVENAYATHYVDVEKVKALKSQK